MASPPCGGTLHKPTSPESIPRRSRRGHRSGAVAGVAPAVRGAPRVLRDRQLGAAPTDPLPGQLLHRRGSPCRVRSCPGLRWSGASCTGAGAVSAASCAEAPGGFSWAELRIWDTEAAALWTGTRTSSIEVQSQLRR
ncbi:hypothetical protein NDU88_003811 [Pleurodeles waltl]|uniref:Uncharacterized protein n=1 Tax=Pleurodeles waltl TaxID=8319 RepID=A0AAV7W811_PLEWA|nr:hypothetical protein NDU88_003811 [Pleurodeles waltl]